MILVCDNSGIITYHSDTSLMHCRDKYYPGFRSIRSYNAGLTSCVSISNKYILIDTQFSDLILKISDPEYRVAVSLLKTWLRRNKLDEIGI